MTIQRRTVRLLAVVDVECDVTFDAEGAVAHVFVDTFTRPTAASVTAEIREILDAGELVVRSYAADLPPGDDERLAEASSALLVALERLRGDLWYD